MPILEIITIGTEILLGEIFDTNSRYLAIECREHGIDLYRVQSIGDNADRIAALMKEAFARADIVITTGGLGPTVDDPTRSAAAKAFDCQLEYKPELFDAIVERMRKFGRSVSENQKKQAYIPSDGIAIHNPVGTAPAFYFEKDRKILICLPGVPSEMEYLWKNAVLPLITQRFDLRSTISVRKLRTYGLGEGSLDELIADLETSENPTVGLSAHFGFVDIRVTAKSNDPSEALAALSELENTIRGRLPNIVFGIDNESIESAIEGKLRGITEPLRVVTDQDSAFLRKFAEITPLIEFVTDPTSANIRLVQDTTDHKVRLTVDHGPTQIDHTRSFLGNPEHYPEWRHNIVYGEFWLALNAILLEN